MKVAAGGIRDFSGTGGEGLLFASDQARSNCQLNVNIQNCATGATNTFQGDRNFLALRIVANAGQVGDALTLTGTGNTLIISGGGAGTGVGQRFQPPTGRAAATADLKAALVTAGLMTAGGASPLDLNGGVLTAGVVTVNGQLKHAGGTAGFFNTTPTTRPSVTGFRAGEPAAAASLRTALGVLGLIVDNTTA